MNKLPEKFPEYSLMYKILGRKIQELELKMESVHPNKIKDVQKSIKN